MRIGKLVVVGVGLIGGSCALALKARGCVGEVVGIGRTQANLDEARRRGIVDRARTLDAPWTDELADADLVLVATPVAQSAAVFAAIAPHLGPRAVLTDAGSTKQDVIVAARAALGDALPRFVPAHPIAGTEHSGAAAAFATLYDGKAVVLTPLPETREEALARVDAFWSSCGGRVQRLPAARHDALFAAVSHLPHVLAFALVDELAQRPEAARYFEFAGSGFRDFTRIAAGSPEMWRDIALANRAALLDEIAAYRRALDAIGAAIEDADAGAIEAVFARASEARRAWGARREREALARNNDET